MLPEPKLENLTKKQLIRLIRTYFLRDPPQRDIAEIIWEEYSRKAQEDIDAAIDVGRELTSAEPDKIRANMKAFDEAADLAEECSEYYQKWLS